MENSHPIAEASLEILCRCSEKLGDLCQEVMFLGGCVMPFLINDKFAPDVRFTQDIDCVVDILCLSDYYQLSQRLQDKGITQSINEAVICRWFFDGIVLDIMPINEAILGFGNSWYQPAISHANQHTLSNGRQISVINASYFLATKFEAFKSRGKQNFLTSHDIEDIVSILDGRAEICDEIETGSSELQGYLSEQFQALLDSSAFIDAVAGHLNYGRFTDERVTVVMAKIKRIAKAATQNQTNKSPLE